MRWIDTGINPHDLSPNTLTPINHESSVVAFLHKDVNGSLTAYENKCSHMGDPLQARSNKLVCATHGWSYKINGENENPSELGLRTLETKISQNKILILNQRKAFGKISNPRVKPLLKLHSHACLELSWNGFSIITDPWIEGEAYYGSWKLWPPPTIPARQLNPDVIVISHPHPDHFHLETLKCLDKETPVYFPKFISNSIDSGLKKLGFVNIFPCDFSTKVQLQSKVFIEFFKPTSAWEDSIVLYSFDDFNILNQNDAGAIFDEESLPSNIDVFACAFDQGASGYPLTWENLSEHRKVAILRHQKEYTLKRIAILCNRYQARYFLPFAGHWRLNLKEHADYASMIPHTSFNEIDSVLEQYTNTKLLNLFPGEFCDFINPIAQVESQRAIVEKDFIPNSDATECEDLTLSDIMKLDDKFQELKSLKKSFGIESILFRILIDERHVFSVDLRDAESLDDMVVEVKIPKYIGRIICDKGLNWDHIAIGYWGRWTRSSTSYPSNFMRALQASSDFLATHPAKETNLITQDVLLNMNMASLIEENSELVLRVLNKHGLPCVGCFYSPGETLRKAIIRHRLPIGTQTQLVRELSEFINI